MVITSRGTSRHTQERLPKIHTDLKTQRYKINYSSQIDFMVNINAISINQRPRRTKRIKMKKNGRLLYNEVITKLQKNKHQYRNRSMKHYQQRNSHVYGYSCREMIVCSINVDWISLWNNIFQFIPHTMHKNHFQTEYNINVRDKTMDLLEGIIGETFHDF